MILVFGGTTEGRKAVEVLEESGATYYYSTKTGEQDITLHHGQRIDGALDREAMRAFCQEHAIRLIVDAAHPFASQLHQTIASISEALNIPVVRYERIYPPRDPSITWIDDYSQVPTDIHSLLATTGVQSISRLKWLEEQGVKVIYRILNRKSSIALAHQQGANDDQLVVGHASQRDNAQEFVTLGCDNAEEFVTLGSVTYYVDAILMKESGLSGGFVEKVEEARQRGLRIIALKRPELSMVNGQWSMVNGPYGLRRTIEKLLPAFYPLHSGLTTGTCATAAAVAATLQWLNSSPASADSSLFTLHSSLPSEVPVILPNGETIHVPVGYGDGYAYCIKEAGDDPDVTNGLEIRATCQMRNEELEMRNGNEEMRHDTRVEIIGGEGVGRFTLPGFDYPPGEAAINKAPRQMIEQNIKSILSPLTPHPSPLTLHLSPLTPPLSPLIITISVPNGEEIAKKTFNPRLGIEGGISIIGVSGIVKPFSEEAFIDSIRKCMTGAKARGTDRVVINSGGKSERFVKALYPTLPQQAFVEYGNYIGETLKMAHELGFKEVTLGVMLGKAVKLAEGQLDTHSRKSTMNKTFIQQMLNEANCPLGRRTLANNGSQEFSINISQLSLARELWDLIPVQQRQSFADTVIRHCAEHCKPLLPNGNLTILLIDNDGHIYE